MRAAGRVSLDGVRAEPRGRPVAVPRGGPRAPRVGAPRVVEARVARRDVVRPVAGGSAAERPGPLVEPLVEPPAEPAVVERSGRVVEPVVADGELSAAT